MSNISLTYFPSMFIFLYVCLIIILYGGLFIMPRDERHTETIPYGTLGIIPLADISISVIFNIFFIDS